MRIFIDCRCFENEVKILFMFPIAFFDRSVMFFKENSIFTLLLSSNAKSPYLNWVRCSMCLSTLLWSCSRASKNGSLRESIKSGYLSFKNSNCVSLFEKYCLYSTDFRHFTTLKDLQMLESSIKVINELIKKGKPNPDPSAKTSRMIP